MPAVALGPQFVVNAYTAGKQYRPFSTALSTGGFVIGWQDESGTGVPIGTQDDVRFARYDGFGARQSPGIDGLANSTTPASQFEGSAAGFADGKYVMVWTDSSETAPDFDNRAVRGQVFNANGTKSGIEFIVNSTNGDSQTQPSVAVLNNGRFAVVWTSGIVGDSGATNVISRVFNADGTPFGGEMTVNTQTVGNQDKPTVQALSTGGFAVVWSDREESPVTGDQTKTFIRFFSPAGNALAVPFVANSAAAGDPQDIDIAELTDGRLVVVYADYETATSDGSGAAVRARIYDPVTSAFAPTINVNTITSNDQLDPQVAALDNGQFVVVWTDASTSGDDPSFTAVRMQVFSATGAKSGGEVLVATTKVFEQQNPVVTVLKDFRFVVAWEDNSQEGADIDAFSIRSRMYDARIAALDLDGSAAADNYQGSNFADTIDGLAGADILKGGNGGDFIFGGVGIDTLFGDAGDDEIDGGDNNDAIEGGANNDTLKGGAGNDEVDGGAGNDFLYTDPGTDTLDGGDGVDTIVFHKAIVMDYLNGVFDPDIALDTWISWEKLQGSSGADTIRLADIFSALEVSGGGGGDTIAASLSVAYKNVLKGEDGDDSLFGGAGDDTLTGGLDDDFLDGGTGTDTADWSAATGALTITLFIDGSGITNNAAGIGVDSVDNIENIIGGAGGDTLNGNQQDNIIDGGAGSDMIDGGGGGTDLLRGGLGNDSYNIFSSGVTIVELAGSGYDSVRTGLAVYTLAANVERLYNDFTSAFTGIGNALDNRIYGNNGDDKFRDYAGGADNFSGGNGSDSMYFTGTAAAILNFATSVHGGSAAGDAYNSIENYFGSNTGGDTMTAGAGRAIFNGQGGNDTLNGGSNIDSLYGGAGLDTLSGGAAVDALYGGKDNDTMTGGAGKDYFVYAETAASGGWGVDTVTDFQDGVDVLKFANAVADAFGDFTITGNGTANVTIKLAAAPANTVILQGAAPITISSADFLFY